MNTAETILKLMPTNRELDVLDKSIWSADPTEQDVLIKDLKKQINKITGKVRKAKEYASQSQEAPDKHSEAPIECYVPTKAGEHDLELFEYDIDSGSYRRYDYFKKLTLSSSPAVDDWKEDVLSKFIAVDEIPQPYLEGIKAMLDYIETNLLTYK